MATIVQHFQFLLTLAFEIQSGIAALIVKQLSSSEDVHAKWYVLLQIQRQALSLLFHRCTTIFSD